MSGRLVDAYVQYRMQQWLENAAAALIAAQEAVWAKACECDVQAGEMEGVTDSMGTSYTVRVVCPSCRTPWVPASEP